MKRFSVVVGLMILGAGVAMASSLNVPFFLDDGENNSNLTTFASISNNADPAKGFIATHNNTTSTIVLTIKYIANNGDNATPANDTYDLTRDQTKTWRPIGDDPGVEARRVPNMVQVLDGNGNPSRLTGSAVITWVGGPSDIQGFYRQTANGGDVFGFLLPPGT